MTVGGVKPEPPTAAELEELKKPMKPLERVAASPKGTLKNPYTDNPEAIDAGQEAVLRQELQRLPRRRRRRRHVPAAHQHRVGLRRYRRHAVPPDLARRRELQKRATRARAREGVVGPMPPFGELIDSDQDVWKIIAWIRTKFAWWSRAAPLVIAICWSAAGNGRPRASTRTCDLTRSARAGLQVR